MLGQISSAAMLCFLFFFFSSRRRHTRFDCDWSSDVCSSPLMWIRLIAPTTSPERLTRAVRGATGFLYLISRLGVTGARDQVPPDLAGHVARVRAASPLPLAVGFGIGTPAQARATAALADGVVVGSAIVEALGRDGLGAAERLVRELAAAVRPPCPPTASSSSTAARRLAVMG